MDRLDPAAIDKLNLTPRSDEQLHATLTNFQLKWEQKARRGSTDRISRF